MHSFGPAFLSDSLQVEATAGTFHPEYGSYMVEGVPRTPYALHSVDACAHVFRNMRARRSAISTAVKTLYGPDAEVVTLTAFPTMGALRGREYTLGVPGETNPVSESSLFPDQAIAHHPRFYAATASFRRRKGCRTCAALPLYQDERTDMFEDAPVGHAAGPRRPWLVHRTMSSGVNPNPVQRSIYMDAVGFGAGLCCLQTTFGCTCMREVSLVISGTLTTNPTTTLTKPLMNPRIGDRLCRCCLPGRRDPRAAGIKG